MEAEQAILNQDDKQWDRVWTTDEIRKNSANWTLAGDVGLYNLLNEFSQNIISRTHEVQNAVDSLVHNTKMASVKINNVINDFHMLSNLQFVENRVYDEEVQDPVPETKPAEKTKEQREAEMLPKIIKAVELGMAVLDQAFNRINVNEISDSEDEDLSSEGRVVFEPKNPYEHRPLPYIIGSEEFMADDYAGLKDLIQEDAETSAEVESSSSESDETSSDEEDLPLDEDVSTIPSPRKELQIPNHRYSSSSEESELFGVEKEENGFMSDSTVDSKVKEEKINQKPTEETKVETRDTRPSSISKLNLPQVLPMPRQPQKKKESDNLFANDESSEDESPFKKKSLFATDVRFGDDDDKDMFEDDLFGSKPKEAPKITEVKKESPVTKPPTIVKKPEEPDLFGDDEDSEDDIFNKLSKVKKPSLPKENLVFKQESPDKADSSSTPSSAPSVKASGSAFDFMTGGRQTDPLFGDDSDGDDLFSTKKTVTKKFDFATEDDEEDDLFGLAADKKPKKTEVPEKKVTENDKPDLFQSDSTAQKGYKKIGMPLPGLTTKKLKDSIFDDSDSDQEKTKVVPPTTKITKPVKDINLFDDDDDEDDIFSQKPKLFSPGKSPSMKSKPEDSIPAVLPQKEEKTEASTEKKVSSLFDDFDQGTKSEKLPVKKTTDTLFEESDTFDLFKPKTVEKTKPVDKEPEKTIPKQVPPSKSGPSLFENSSLKDKTQKQEVPKPSDRPSLFSTPDEVDGSASSKTKTVTPPKTAVVSESLISDFDTPVDTSKTLNSLSKDRVKVTTKRRKPTRKGRLAAIENKSDDDPTETVAPTPAKSSSIDSADDLFSVAEPAEVAKAPVTHKSQEKKKMDLMSQLMSEAASSRIGKKAPAPKVEEEEDVVDIFAELGGANRDKSQSFSFKSPIESTSKASFPEDDKDDDKSILPSGEADNDEFFAEPSFRKFSSSISQKESILELDDDEDDLFSIKPSPALSKAKVDPDDTDIFADDTDIFADIPKEKYEMFPSQLYDDEDDIFSNLDQTTSKPDKSTAKTTSSASVKKEEKKQVKEVEKKPVFDDPLSGLLGED